MKRAAYDFANFPDERLFRQLAEGIPLIVENAVSLDETAQHLHRQEDFRASEIFRGFAEEEAAKVLILIDLVRCPRDWKKRTKIPKRFYGHVAKRIYAMTCSYPRIASFKEFCELVQTECRPYYLDGPNSVDWIFWNNIAAKRGQNLYVDYTQELSDEPGDYHWIVPPAPLPWNRRYKTPDCVKLSQALSEAGAGSPHGLAMIAKIWRRFVPVPETDREELYGLIALTLDRLGESGLNSADESSKSFIVTYWPFPLWPLTIKEPLGKEDDLKKLREERERTIEWIEEKEAKRNPPPAISRSKVEALSEAHAAWAREVNARGGGRSTSVGGLRIRSGADISKDFELPSYKRLTEMYGELPEDERAALLALAWFGREIGVADWSHIYAQARDMVGPPDEGYDIGLGSYWLAGLDRWGKSPQPFEAGRWSRG